MIKKKIDINRILFFTAAAVAVLAFLCTAYRAMTTNLTDDEAYTVLFYVHGFDPFSYARLKEIFMTCKANNHWLNTFLIYVSTSLCGSLYSEAAVRMPAVLLFGAYLAAALTALGRRRISFTAFMFLTCNYYLNEFMGLARGYGAAAAFLLFTLLLYMDYREAPDRKKSGILNMLLLMLTLASLSNTVVLLAYPSIGLLILYHCVKEKSLIPYMIRNLLPVLLFVIATGFLVVYHLTVSERDTGLYVGTESFFKSTIMEYAGMLVTNRLFAAGIIMLAGILAAAGIVVSARKIKTGGTIDRTYADLFLMLLIFVAVNLLSGVIFHKGYITGRTTLPFWGLIVLGYEGLFRGLILPAENNAAPGKEKNAALWKGISLTAAALVFILFVKKIDLTKTRDWSWDYGTRERVEKSVQKTGTYSEDLIQDYADVYYMSKEGLDISRYEENAD